jgi:mRNA interferase MazF
MPTFKQGDIVRVPFPYTDRDTRQRRPAFVVSNGGIGEAEGLLWVAMITSAENRSWPQDVPIPAHLEAGLPAPSVVRPVKLATVEARSVEPLGAANPSITDAVMVQVAQLLGRN